MNIEYIGEKLRALRKNRGWTQGQLAKRLDVVTGTVSAYETGLKYPSLEMLVKISKVFNTSVDFLLGLTDKKVPLQMAGLTEAQMAPFLQIVAEMMQYNALRETTKGKEPKLKELDK